MEDKYELCEPGLVGLVLLGLIYARHYWNGEEVLCLDNFFTGRKKNIVHLIGHPRFEIIRMILPAYPFRSRPDL